MSLSQKAKDRQRIVRIGTNIWHKVLTLPLPFLTVKKLVDLEEFQRQKDELMTKLQNLEKQLECQQEKHKDEIHSLEMKDLLEKRKLRSW